MHVSRFETGSALVLVLVILTTLTILCTLILKGAGLHSKVIIQSQQAVQAFYLSEGAIYKTLWMLSGHEGKGWTWRPIDEIIPVFDEQVAKVTVRDWGGFVRITAEATCGMETVQLCVFAGITPPKEYTRAILLGGRGYPLVVTGKNRIVGDVRVGMKGVETGMIRGQGFTGTQPVEGKIERVQSPTLPPLDLEHFQQVIASFESELSFPNVEYIHYQNLVLDSSFMRAHPVQNIYVNGHITVYASGSKPLFPDDFLCISSGDITIQGFGYLGKRIHFLSGGEIRILEAPDLHIGLCYARKGIVLSHAGKMDVQCFTPDDIVLLGPTELSYPSFLFSWGKLTEEKFQGHILVSDNSRMEGTVLLSPLVSIPERLPNEAQIVVQKSAEVKGILYSANQTILEGTVLGCVTTEEFFLELEPTTYIDWVKDATIDRTQLPSNYVMPVGFDKNPRFEILIWEETKRFRQK